MINSCKNCCGYYLGNFWSYLGNFLNSASGHTVRPLQLSLSFSLFQCTKCTDPFCLSFSNVVVQILHFPPHTVHMVSAVVVGHNSLFLVHKIVRSGRRRRRWDWIVRAGRDCENWTSVHPPSRHATSRHVAGHYFISQRCIWQLSKFSLSDWPISCWPLNRTSPKRSYHYLSSLLSLMASHCTFIDSSLL